MIKEVKWATAGKENSGVMRDVIDVGTISVASSSANEAS